VAIDLEQIHGAGGRACRAEEVDFHARLLSHRWNRGESFKFQVFSFQKSRKLSC
jgi:hypothetical protein